jgi:hypothetical protein
MSILPDRCPSLGRGVPLAGIGELRRPVNSGDVRKRDETAARAETRGFG